MANTDLMGLIASLLAKAESTDNPHEREAYMAAAQAKATRAQIDLAEARRVVDSRTVREEPVRESVYFSSVTGEPTYNIQRPVLVAYVELFDVIARANDVRLLIYTDASGVIAHGMPSDIALCRALFTYLLSQMVSECHDHLKHGHRETSRVWSDRHYRYVDRKTDARTERRSFMEAFASVVGQRLREARREAIAAAEAEEIDSARFDGGSTPAVSSNEVGALTRTALVLRDKATEVDEFFKGARKGVRGSFKGNGYNRPTSYSGHTAGRAAGARANLAAHSTIGA